MVLADLIGDSPGIAELRDKVGRLVGRFEAGRLPPVLLQGETGTGKGLLAHALHCASPRRSGPFIDVNCAAIPESLLETEMFGVERGAFTGADRARPGLFQAAHRGTLFLDEIGLIPKALQSKLLKAIEDRAIRRLGRNTSEPVDVWILTATNEDLDEAMQTERFRPDLYHRLAVVTLRLPPLRERGADVDLLAEHFLGLACANYGLPRKTLTEDARTALHGYRWPGNVRELANVLERAALLSDGAVLSAEALQLGGRDASDPTPPRRRHDGGALREMLERTERERLLEALQQTNWNLSHAAARLHLPRNSLRYRMERHGLRSPPPSRRRAGLPEAPTASSQSARPAPPTTPALVGGDRRQISWLRVDLVGGSLAAWESDTSRALEVIAEKIHGFGGEIEALSRTEVVAAFGIEPVEDAPRRAALAAVAVQKAAEHGRRDGAWPWSVTIGIHVHDCVLGPAGSGVAVAVESTQAAKAMLEALVGVAPPDSVLISEASASLLERRFDLVPSPPAARAEPAAYRLTGREHSGFGLSGRLTEFVGRQEELALLTSRLDSALSGQGQVVAIVGEAGIGKSRLLAEFRQSLATQHITYLEGGCASYASAVPYLPVLEIVRQHCGITEPDGPETIADKVRLALQTLGMAPAEHAPYLLQLLGVNREAELRGVNPELMKARIFEALRQQILRASRRRALVLAVEDLHWIDKTSDELVALLVETLPGTPILVVTTYRPGYQPPWLARSYVTQVALPPLSNQDSRTVLRSALHIAPVPPQVLDLMVARADGNPFFLEELAKAVGEHAEHGADVAVPDTIQAVLAARIDRLAPEPERVLQAAAVIGKDVPVVLLQAIAGETEVGLRASLRQLQTADFLYETRPPPELEYTFKHALTHEVAYGTLTPPHRRDLHAKIARVLVRAFPEMAESRPEVVARHLTAAELPGEAIPHWLKAGRSAIRRSANVEAVSHLKTAIALSTREPGTPERDGQELELQLALGPALVMTEGYAAAKVEAVYRRAQALCEGLGETPQLFSALWGIAVFHIVRGDLRSARAVGERLLNVATKSRNEELLLEAHLALGVALFYQGFLQDARAHFEASISLYDAERHAAHAFVYGQDPCVASLGFLGWVHVLQEHGSEALSCIDRALRRAEIIDHAFPARSYRSSRHRSTRCAAISARC